MSVTPPLDFGEKCRREPEALLVPIRDGRVHHRLTTFLNVARADEYPGLGSNHAPADIQFRANRRRLESKGTVWLAEILLLVDELGTEVRRELLERNPSQVLLASRRSHDLVRREVLDMAATRIPEVDPELGDALRRGALLVLVALEKVRTQLEGEISPQLFVRKFLPVIFRDGGHERMTRIVLDIHLVDRETTHLLGAFALHFL